MWVENGTERTGAMFSLLSGLNEVVDTGLSNRAKWMYKVEKEQEGDLSLNAHEMAST